MTKDPEKPAVTETTAAGRAETVLQEHPALDGVNLDRLETQPERLDFAERYQERAPLGEGGMGVVQLCDDRLIGRDVAMKLIRPEIAADGNARHRFLREAQLQGQLEHPAVVPVHDLGLGPDGQIYFTMKRVRGVTLDDILEAAQAQARIGVDDVEQRRLLTAFSQVCLAVDFAHERGVVHRDLKPSNIMLGDFGEVYVLDWGVATVTDVEPVSRRLVTPSPDELQTSAGAVVGTPGFIAPEVIALGAEAASRQSDVYALGAILYELITDQPLVPVTDGTQMLVAALSGTPPTPSEAAPEREVPPELEATCLGATARDPADRTASARQLHQAIEAYLAGDRDRELRRKAAQSHAVAARDAAVEALSSGALQPRETAMREVGRALALDPQNRAAMRTLIRLMSEPPAVVPDEAKSSLEREEASRTVLVSNMGSLAYLAMVAHVPFLLWMGIASWTWFLLGGGVAAIAAVLCAIGGRQATPNRMLQHFVWLSGAFSVGVLSLMFGPFFLVPGMVIIQVISLALISRPAERTLYLTLSCGAVLVPWLLQLLGWVPASYRFADGELHILPALTHFQATPTLTFLLLTSIAQILLGALLIARVRRALEVAQERIHVRAWHLKNLMPEDALAEVPASTARPPAT